MAAHSANKILNYVPLGDQTLVVQFENKVSIQVNRCVQSFANLIENKRILGITQLIITFNSLAICYDPIRITYSKLVEIIQSLEEHNSKSKVAESKKVHIPVVFGGDYGPDVNDVAVQVGLSPEEVIQTLNSKPYYVYMVGFIAGSPYCGDIDAKLSLPRRSNPRLKVKKGTIAIANNQTNIYTMDSPGGWHLVGWTPMEIFNPYWERSGLLLAGDYIQYKAITADEAERWDEQRQREWDQEWISLK